MCNGCIIVQIELLKIVLYIGRIGVDFDETSVRDFILFANATET